MQTRTFRYQWAPHHRGVLMLFPSESDHSPYREGLTTRVVTTRTATSHKAGSSKTHLSVYRQFCFRSVGALNTCRYRRTTISSSLTPLRTLHDIESLSVPVLQNATPRYVPRRLLLHRISFARFASHHVGCSHSICDISLVKLRMQIVLLHCNHTLIVQLQFWKNFTCDTIDPNLRNLKQYSCNHNVDTSMAEYNKGIRLNNDRGTEDEKLMTHHTSKKQTPSLPTHLREICKNTNMHTRASGCLQRRTSIFHPTYRRSNFCPHHPCTLFILPCQNHRLRSTHDLRSRVPLRNSAY